MKMETRYYNREPVFTLVKLSNTESNERKARKLVLLLVERGWSFNYKWVRVGRRRYIHKFWIASLDKELFLDLFWDKIDSILPI